MDRTSGHAARRMHTLSRWQRGEYLDSGLRFPHDVMLGRSVG